eukprot:UC4_evm5s1290
MEDWGDNIGVINDDAPRKTFMQLALEGERLSRSGNKSGSIVLYKDALKVGSENLEALSAVHSQLGNACFCVKDFTGALENHQKDLEISKSLKDTIGIGKAYGNLGNTYKAIGSHAKAIKCYELHLKAAKSTNDDAAEARAYDNLGNVYHTLGNHLNHQHPNHKSSDSMSKFNTAIDYYEKNYKIVARMNNLQGMGRACGNLGNTFELLGDFTRASEFHQKRLAIAKKLGDRPAEGRAYCNIGNAYRSMGDFKGAILMYEQDLAIAQELEDEPGMAITYSNLGSVHQALGDAENAIKYHEKHLEIVTKLDNKSGLAWAHGNLGTVYEVLGNYKQAISHHECHIDICSAVGDKNGAKIARKRLERCQELMSSGQKVDPKAANAAMAALVPTQAPRSIRKNTIRGTISRVFSKKGYGRKNVTEQMYLPEDTSESTSNTSANGGKEQRGDDEVQVQRRERTGTWGRGTLRKSLHRLSSMFKNTESNSHDRSQFYLPEDTNVSNDNDVRGNENEDSDPDLTIEDLPEPDTMGTKSATPVYKGLPSSSASQDVVEGGFHAKLAAKKKGKEKISFRSEEFFKDPAEARNGQENVSTTTQSKDISSAYQEFANQLAEEENEKSERNAEPDNHTNNNDDIDGDDGGDDDEDDDDEDILGIPPRSAASLAVPARSAASLAVPTRSAASKQGNTEVKYRAMHKYQAGDDDEVSFREDDIITVLVPDAGDGWVTGRVERSGEEGRIASSYLEPLSSM